MKTLHKRALALAPLLVGIGALVWQNRNRAEAPTIEVAEVARPLRIMTVAGTEVRPVARGYGLAQAARTWRAIARVGGRVISVNERLERGARFSAGEVLLEIDPTPYKLEIARLEAEIGRTKAELAELAQREANDRELLAIDQRALELARSDEERLERLHESGSVSLADADAARQNALAYERSVQSLRSNIELAPSQRAAKQATLEAQEATLEAARLDLGYATIRMPFDAIVGAVSVEVDQVVSTGEQLFVANGVERAIVEAEFLYGEARRLIGPEAVELLAASIVRGGEVDPSELGRLFEATARMVSGDFAVHWDADVVGVREELSSSARAITLRVAIDEPFDQAVPGVRPALLPGTFCEVELAGMALADRVVVPRAAVRNGQVYALNDQDRLELRDVEIEFEQGEAAVLRAGANGGLEVGARVVVADPGPLLPGTLVAPVEDPEVAAALRSDVARRDG